MQLSITIKLNNLTVQVGKRRNTYRSIIYLTISVGENIICNKSFGSGDFSGAAGHNFWNGIYATCNKISESKIFSMQSENSDLPRNHTLTFFYTAEVSSYLIAKNKLSQLITLSDNSQLIGAINSAIDIVSTSVQNELSEKQQYDINYSLLHLQASSGDPAIEQNLKQNDINVNQQTSMGRTPLHEAAQSGQLATVKLLVEYGAGLDMCDLFGNQARELAAKNGHEDVVEYLETTMREVGMKIIKMNSSASDNMLRAQINVFEHIENLVFQGGGVKGFAYIGALQELAHYVDFNQIQRTCGTSAGALTALLVGLNYSLEEDDEEHASELLVTMNALDLMSILDNENGFRDLFLALKKYSEEKLADAKYEDMAKEIGALVAFYLANRLSQKLDSDAGFMGMIQEKFKQLQKTAFYKGTKGIIKSIFGKRIANAITPKDLLSQSPIGIGAKDIKPLLGIVAKTAEDSIKDLRLAKLLQENTVLQRTFNKIIDKLIDQFLANYGMFSGKSLREKVDGFIEEKIKIANATFAELHQFRIHNPYLNIKDIYFVAVDVATGMPTVFSYEHTPTAVISDAAMASMSIPLFFEPREMYVKNCDGQRIAISAVPEKDKKHHHKIWQYREHIFIDGGISENYPLWVFDSVQYIDAGKQQPSDIPIYNSKTLGMRLVSSDLMEKAMEDRRPETIIDNFGAYLWGIGAIFLGQQEGKYLQRADRRRTLYIDSLDIDAAMFDLTDSQKQNLIESGKKGINASILKISGKASNCLLLAAKNNDEHVAKIALQAKATPTAVDINRFHHGWNAIHWAAYNGNNRILSMLLDIPSNQVYLNSKTSSAYSRVCSLWLYQCAGEQTPMELAQQRGHEHTVKLLEHYFTLYPEAADIEQVEEIKLTELKN